MGPPPGQEVSERRLELGGGGTSHIASRSRRYPQEVDLTIDWTQEAVEDKDAVLINLYPRSRVGAAAFVGFSPGAQRALVVLVHRDLAGRWHGRTAWPATGRDLTLYEKGLDNDSA